MQTQTRNSINTNNYTVGFKNYKTNGVKMREVIVYQNGKWIYRDKFQAEQRAQRELWAQKFVQSMKIHDTKEYLSQLEQMKGF